MRDYIAYYTIREILGVSSMAHMVHGLRFRIHGVGLGRGLTCRVRT